MVAQALGTPGTSIGAATACQVGGMLVGPKRELVVPQPENWNLRQKGNIPIGVVGFFGLDGCTKNQMFQYNQSTIARCGGQVKASNLRWLDQLLQGDLHEIYEASLLGGIALNSAAMGTTSIAQIV